MIRSIVLSIVLSAAASAGIDLRLPTENHQLFEGENEQFFTYVDRSFEGVASNPWQAGSFGLVRNALRDGQETRITTLGELREEDVDMLTILVVGNSVTVLRDGRMVTPRGYRT